MRMGLVAIGAVGALIAGCGEGDGVRISTSGARDGSQPPLKVVETLQCPQILGPLTRKGAAQEEGGLCLYSGPRGAEVKLYLERLDVRTAEQVLALHEDGLKAGLRWAEDVEAAPRIVTVDAKGERAEVRAPGVSIEAEGESAHIRIGPISIRSNRRAEAAPERTGETAPESPDAASAPETVAEDAVSVRAGRGGSEVRVREGGEGVRAIWRLSGGRAVDRGGETGWRQVGYTARGPAGGPLVVATVRSRDGDGEALFDAVDELVRLNVGD